MSNAVSLSTNYVGGGHVLAINLDYTSTKMCGHTASEDAPITKPARLPDKWIYRERRYKWCSQYYSGRACRVSMWIDCRFKQLNEAEAYLGESERCRYPRPLGRGECQLLGLAP